MVDLDLVYLVQEGSDQLVSSIQIIECWQQHDYYSLSITFDLHNTKIVHIESSQGKLHACTSSVLGSPPISP